jgi:hypothetical protein
MSIQTETKIKSAHHEIAITRDGQHAIPSACPAMNIGDTARYSSPDGEVKVVFVDAATHLPASPFEAKEITGSAPQTVIKSGQFEFRCFVKVGSEFIGWDALTSPKSGGQFPVPPNTP